MSSRRRGAADEALVREWQDRRRELQREARKVQPDDRVFATAQLKEASTQQQLAEFCTSTWRRVERVREALASLRESVKAGLPPANVRSAIDQFETRLAGAKASLQSAYEVLLEEGKTLEEELAEVSLAEYEGSSRHGELARDSAREREKTALKVADTFEKTLAVQAQIGAIDRQLAQLGGRCGGWEARDHDAFLAALTKHTEGDATRIRVDRQTVGRLLAVLPNKNEVDVSEHITWHQRYEDLHSQKRAVVEAWRRMRIPPSSIEEVLPEVEEDHAEDDRTLRRRVETKERLRQWKEEREAARARQEEESKQREMLEDLRDQERRHREKVQKKLMLNAWREHEEEEALAKARPPESKERIVDQKVILECHDRDMEKVRERVKRLDEKRTKDERREKLLMTESKSELAERDPQRLLRETKAFESNKANALDMDTAARSRAVGGAHAAKVFMGGYDLKFKGRAKPAWCKVANL